MPRACPSDTHPAPTGTICIPDAGYHWDADGRVEPCPTGSADTVTDCLCVPGFHLDAGGVCQPCPADHYCPLAGDEQVPCPTALLVPPGAVSGRACLCPAGSTVMLAYSTGQCRECPPGSFCEGWSHEVRCDDHAHAVSAAGAASFAVCTPIAGYYEAGWHHFLACYPGHYCPCTRDSMTCPPGQTTTSYLATSQAACVCLDPQPHERLSCLPL
eukprot:3215340-Rhodomonas_salina.1